jgi:Lrp/AsnC family leucine-responsive transcriptional regulator
VAGGSFDEVDETIVGLLCENSRRTMEDIGARVGLAPSSVTRRIARLERIGVIGGYTVVLGAEPTGRTLRAFSEIQLAPSVTVADLREWVAGVEEVDALHRTTGEAEALIAWRLDRPERLGQLLEELRAKLEVHYLRTVVALETWEAGRTHVAPPGLSADP